MKIRTDYVYPPIPLRNFDWSAIDDDTYDGPGSKIGFGPTEQAAVADLLEQVDFSLLKKIDGSPDHVPHDCLENLNSKLVCSICGAKFVGTEKREEAGLYA